MPPAARSDVRKKVIARIGAAPLVLGLMFFLPAGSLKFWEAWIYMGLILLLMSSAILHLLKKDPGLLERRLRGKEKERGQSLLAWVSSPFYLALFVLPGFDHRFGWSEVPVPLILAGDILMLAGYALFFRVLRENSYLSRIVEVEAGQAVIDTGPYSLVRHPMYVAVLAMFTATPVALGSWWSLLAAAPVPLFLVLRIRGEEKLMRENLPGYPEYCGKVRFRLLPGIW